MNQQKTGVFLKTLRKQKGLTQQQLAEKFNVSNRTVSRWENGNHMPDLDILIELSDFYDVNLREMLDGERKSAKMDEKMEKTILKAVDYTNMATERFTKRVHRLLLIGAVLWLISSFINHTACSINTAGSAVADFSEGAAIGMILCGILFTSRYAQKIKAFKLRLRKR